MLLELLTSSLLRISTAPASPLLTAMSSKERIPACLPLLTQPPLEAQAPALDPAPALPAARVLPCPHTPSILGLPLVCPLSVDCLACWCKERIFGFAAFSLVS